MIDKFDEEYSWLSNFHPATVILDGTEYPSVENAYQAAKVPPSDRPPYTTCSAAASKRLSRFVELPKRWHEDNAIEVMRKLIAQKYAYGTMLGAKLLSTRNKQLVEGNWWGDRFWGECQGEGRNELGKLSMQQRDFLHKCVDMDNDEL